VESREKKIFIGSETCRKLKFNSKVINDFLISKESSPIDSSETIANLCRRPELSLKELLNLNGFSENENIKPLLQDGVALNQVEIDLKYEGYLKRQEEMIAKMEKYENH
jgi:tRNA uridine 5-carboxymethylaminomethyl modification enzyme